MAKIQKKRSQSTTQIPPWKVWLDATTLLGFAYEYEKAFSGRRWSGYTNSLEPYDGEPLKFEHAEILKPIRNINNLLGRFWKRREKQIEKQLKVFLFNQLYEIYKAFNEGKIDKSGLVDTIDKELAHHDLKPHHLKWAKQVTKQFIKERGGPSRAAREIVAKIIGNSTRWFDNLKGNLPKKQFGLIDRDKLFASCLGPAFSFDEDGRKAILSAAPKYDFGAELKKYRTSKKKNAKNIL
jgi:hypothetical protein